MWFQCREKGACGVWGWPFSSYRPFLGLSLSDAKKLSSYFHFREAIELKNKPLLEKADLDPSLDFMDSLEHDIPKGNSLLTRGHGSAPRSEQWAMPPAILLWDWNQGPGWELVVPRGFLRVGLPQGPAHSRHSVNIFKWQKVGLFSICIHRKEIPQYLLIFIAILNGGRLGIFPPNIPENTSCIYISTLSFGVLSDAWHMHGIQ